jgi:Flp pilus assembly protein TadD
MLLLRRGDHAGAMQQLRRAVELASGDRRAVGRYRAAGALPDLEQRRARAPRDSTALYNLALAYALTDQHERARGVLAVLREVAPLHAGARELTERLPPE